MTELPDPSAERQAPSHTGGPDTEQHAADLITPKGGTLRGKALFALSAAGADGLTDQELSERTGVYLYSIAPRRNELMLMGWVEDSGRRRKSARDRPAVVWVLTPAATVALAGDDHGEEVNR